MKNMVMMAQKNPMTIAAIATMAFHVNHSLFRSMAAVTAIKDQFHFFIIPFLIILHTYADIMQRICT